MKRKAHPALPFILETDDLEINIFILMYLTERL